MRITAEEKDKTQEILLIPTGAVCRFTFALGTREKKMHVGIFFIKFVVKSI